MNRKNRLSRSNISSIITLLCEFNTSEWFHRNQCLLTFGIIFDRCCEVLILDLSLLEETWPKKRIYPTGEIYLNTKYVFKRRTKNWPYYFSFWWEAEIKVPHFKLSLLYLKLQVITNFHLNKKKKKIDP